MPNTTFKKSLFNSTNLKNPPTVDLFIAGTGAVGGTLIDQIKTIDNTNINIVGACNTEKLQWFEHVDSQSTHWATILKKLSAIQQRPVILVDATGSEEVARLYTDFFEAGIHIVTPSKLANTFEQSYYNLMRKTATKNKVLFRYETTIGAGLPILSTINDLLKTGDTITEISGVVSGTMTYLFGQLEQGITFSKAIVYAREKGYAEPDPRDDLSGEDVARKFLTLAREININIERDDLKVESLIPEELASLDRKDFLNRLPEFDEEWMTKLERVQKNGNTLRYMGRLAEGNITIGVQEVSQNSPLGNLKGTDNLIQISTKCYSQTPIIIQGPGAGKEVTAAGVLADILKVVDSLI